MFPPATWKAQAWTRSAPAR